MSTEVKYYNGLYKRFDTFDFKSESEPYHFSKAKIPGRAGTTDLWLYINPEGEGFKATDGKNGRKWSKVYGLGESLIFEWNEMGYQLSYIVAAK